LLARTGRFSRATAREATVPAQTRSYRDLTAQRVLRLDRREGIGPHHLAIGKTRKLFEWRSIVHAFFSTGYEIRHTRVDSRTMEILDSSVVPAPVGWGGGAFCVDVAPNGTANLVFIHRNKLELAFLRGKVSADGIAWDAWQTLLRGTARLAAPWLELDLQGNAWCSALARDGDFKVALVRADGTHQVENLFAPGEEPWFHSCVQVLPIGRGRAVAVGFRGTFPTTTELVWKTVGADLAAGPSQSLAPCNVNDALTFHFQAVGDPRRGRAHIVYLDRNLSTSHAMLEKGAWRVTTDVLERPGFAPQICLDESGALSFVGADYEGSLWSSCWQAKTGWSPTERIRGVAGPNISAAFGRTGYGTGGLIGAARSTNGQVPFLYGVIEDDRTAEATLYLSMLGAGRGLHLAKDTLSVSVKGKTIDVAIRLDTLRKEDTERAGQCWLVVIPAASGDALKVALLAGAKGVTPVVFRQHPDGRVSAVKASTRFAADFHGPFTSRTQAALHAKISLAAALTGLKAGQAWVETYENWSRKTYGAGATLIDVAPFEFEPAAATARNPGSIPQLFRRIL
jgi:hypothetical protein